MGHPEWDVIGLLSAREMSPEGERALVRQGSFGMINLKTHPESDCIGWTCSNNLPFHEKQFLPWY